MGGNVFVYADRGAEAVSLRHAVRELQRELGSEYRVLRIRHEDVIEGRLEEGLSLVMPGGIDSGYYDDLRGIGCEKIRAFVARGGSYLGLCAGAYFACRRLRFEVGTPLEVVEERELRFFPGTAEGSALGVGSFSLDSKAGAAAARVIWPEGKAEGVLFYYGGCRFIIDPKVGDEVDDLEARTTSTFREVGKQAVRKAGMESGEATGLQGTDLETLVYYLSEDSFKKDQPDDAIVACQYGKGKVVLSGLHPEINPHYLNKEDPYVGPLIEPLLASEPMRRRLFRSLLLRCGLTPQDVP